MASYLFNHWNVADAETEKKPPRVGFSQSLLSGGHGYRIAGVNICNPCGNDYSAGCAEK
jgi:hypothetical protein